MKGNAGFGLFRDDGEYGEHLITMLYFIASKPRLPHLSTPLFLRQGAARVSEKSSSLCQPQMPVAKH
jgi:hypothetical protein